MSLTNIIIPVIMQQVIMISKQHMGTMAIIKYCKRLDSQNSLAHVVKCDAYMHMHLFLYACVSVSLLSLHLNLTPLPFQLFPYQLSICLYTIHFPNQIFYSRVYTSNFLSIYHLFLLPIIHGSTSLPLHVCADLIILSAY